LLFEVAASTESSILSLHDALPISGLSETPVTVRAVGTASVRWTPTASDGPLFVTEIVKVWAEVPALTEASVKALSITRATERETERKSTRLKSIDAETA